MEALLNKFLPFVSDHLFLTYFLIFLATLLESLPIFGLFVPSTLLIVFAGVVVATGAISLYLTLFLAFLGAVLGDNFSFWMGYHYHQHIKAIWPFNKVPWLFTRGENFFKKYGGKSVFIGRFIGPMRAMVSVIAGMVNMNPVRFVVVDIFSVAFWTAVHIFPGYLIGGSLMVAGDVSFRLLLFIFVLVIIFWIAFWLFQKIFKLLEHLSKKKERLIVLFFLVFLFAIWLFVEVIDSLVHFSLLPKADEAIYQFLQSIRTPWGDDLLVAISELSDWVVNISIAATVLVVLLLLRRIKEAGFWFITVVGGWALVVILNWLLHSLRLNETGDSITSWGLFPSEHTSMSGMIYGFMAVMLMHSFQSTWRWLPFGFAIIISFLVAISRIYLGIYGFSSVLAGFALGWAWITLMGLLFLHFSKEPLPRIPLSLAVVVPLALVGAWNIHHSHSKDVIKYKPQQTLSFMTEQQWWEGRWESLPLYRIELSGKEKEPLNFQWCGDPAKLSMSLQQKGWRPKEGSNYTLFINLFMPHEVIAKLPLLPKLENGQKEEVLLYRNLENTRLVLRLWPTAFSVSDKGPYFWVGMVQSERAVNVSSLLTVPKGIKDYSAAIEKLASDITFEKKYVQEPEVIKDKEGSWDGKLLLIRSSKS